MKWLPRYLFQAIKRAKAFTIPLESTNPCIPLGMFLQPGIWRSDQQKTTWIEPCMNGCEQFGRIVKTIDEVGCKDEIVTGKNGLEVTGVALVERHFMLHAIQAEAGQRTLSIENEIALIR